MPGVSDADVEAHPAGGLVDDKGAAVLRLANFDDRNSKHEEIIISDVLEVTDSLVGEVFRFVAAVDVDSVGVGSVLAQNVKEKVAEGISIRVISALPPSASRVV